MTTTNHPVNKQAVREYRLVQKEGRFNMLDVEGVLDYAFDVKLNELASLTHEEYRYILCNYTALSFWAGVHNDTHQQHGPALPPLCPHCNGSGGFVNPSRYSDWTVCKCRSATE